MRYYIVDKYGIVWADFGTLKEAEACFNTYTTEELEEFELEIIADTA